MAYGLPAVEALGIAPALRPAARGGLAAYGALERRMIPPAGQLNIRVGPSAKAEFLNQTDPAVRAMITDQLKLQGLRDVQITDGVIRDEIARRNAATMLGLPAENTAAARAAALGFDTQAYHGSKSTITEFSPRYYGSTNKNAEDAVLAAFSSDNPQTANQFATARYSGNDVPSGMASKKEMDYYLKKEKEYKELDWNLGEDARRWMNEHPGKQITDDPEMMASINYQFDAKKKEVEFALQGLQQNYPKVYPLLLRDNNILTVNPEFGVYDHQEWAKILSNAKEHGYSGVRFQDVYDTPKGSDSIKGTTYANFNPFDIRSRFAAFDPARAKESDILAGIAGLSFIPALTLQDYFRQGQ